MRQKAISDGNLLHLGKISMQGVQTSGGGDNMKKEGISMFFLLI